MSKMYHLLIANYSIFDFKQLKEEIEDKTYAGILWSNPKNMKYEKGDIVYIYYCDLPDEMSRILIKAIVENPKCWYDEKQNIKGFTIKLKNVLKPSNIKRFSLKELKEKYKINNFQSGRYLREPDYSELIEDIEKTINNGETMSFGELKSKYFSFKCEYKIPGISKNIFHETFKKENGLEYFQYHHLIPRKCEKIISPEIIYSDANLIKLCPLCHLKIHNAIFSERKEMIEYFYLQRKEELQKIGLDSVLEKQGFNNVLDWLYKQYGTKDCVLDNN